MIQIKKCFLSLFLFLLLLFNFSFESQGREIIEENLSDVGQKSVIDEQVLPVAGAGEIFIPNSELEYDIIEIIISEEEIEETIISKPYANIIDTLTNEEKELICKIVWQEARGESQEGQCAVIEVILNRLISDRWPDSIVDILSAPRQFSTWKNRNNIDQENLEKMYQILDLVYAENNTILEDQEYVYFNCKKPKKDNINIGNHWFWK